MSSLDTSLLDRVRHHPSGKIIARCPACAETGGDRKGDHLAIFPDGRFTCVAAGNALHRQRIFAHIGITPERTHDPEERLAWIERRNQERQQQRQRQALADIARGKRHSIIARHPWTPAEVWDDSPQRVDCDLVATNPAHFLASLFPASALLWTGHVHDSGKPHHKSNWRLCSQWRESLESMGPMTTPAIWNPGTFSRAAGNVIAAPFTVLDFDGFDGVKPTTPAELRRHILDSLALIRWLREYMDWQLAAILWTGGKSLHAWFHSPPPDVLGSLAPVASVLGMDAGLIGHPEHPCRLPGQRHTGTGKTSRVLWLQVPLRDDCGQHDLARGSYK